MGRRVGEAVLKTYSPVTTATVNSTATAMPWRAGKRDLCVETVTVDVVVVVDGKT